MALVRAKNDHPSLCFRPQESTVGFEFRDPLTTKDALTNGARFGPFLADFGDFKRILEEYLRRACDLRGIVAENSNPLGGCSGSCSSTHSTSSMKPIRSISIGFVEHQALRIPERSSVPCRM